MKWEVVYSKIIEGIRKYFNKSGFKKGVIGVSGGLDSAITAFLTAEAIGRENIIPLFMKAKFTSLQSQENAYELCKRISVELIEFDITDIFDKYLEKLSKKFIIKRIEIPEENLQARIRANFLMYVANKEKALVIATGNRSEILTGYCTLYGDTVGAIAPIGDLYKTEIYELTKWINKTKGKVIPSSIIKRPPTAELNKDQLDENELLPYRILDPILKLYVDEKKNKEEIIKAGFKKEDVEKTLSLFKSTYYKRIKLPVIVKLR
ncbi:MAG: NAD(+) synthase [candidate division WOR-3 bacterium]